MSEGHTERLEAALAGRYRIERKLGEGGMASVYLAEDLKHERKVALKILRPELAAVLGAERFLSEIKTTANLQHPHILPLFDSGSAEGYLYYVMPYIDGETLRDKLDREKQLGVDESVRIARDVADALDYAHRHGVIHRDIKPGNVLLHDGRPVVADFGIALAVSAAGGGRMTETGLSLGTPHYMSPEQASADRDLSARSDVYSLGCVLYEMIAGQPPHTGPSAQSILVRILTETPRQLTTLRHTVPPHVASAVAKAIEKLPADRFESAKAFRDALEDSAFRHEVRAVAEATGAATRSPPAAAEGRLSGSWVHAAATALLAASTLLFGWMALTRTGASNEGGVVAFVLTEAAPGWGPPTVGSDGSVVFWEFRGEPGWYRLEAGALEPTLLAGVGEAWTTVLSPDAEWLAFIDSEDGGRRVLRRMPARGGPTTTLWDMGRSSLNLIGAPAWSDDGWIYASVEGAFGRVPENGGPFDTLLPLTSVAVSRTTALPGGRGLLLTIGRAPMDPGNHVVLFEPERGDTVTVIEDGFDAHWSPTGHLIYAHSGGALYALPFDLRRLEATGPAVPVLDDVAVGANLFGRFNLSPNGTLVYVKGSAGADAGISFALLDPGGALEVLRLEPTNHPDVAISPDGGRIAYTRNSHIWIYDLDRGTNRQLSDEGTDHHNPIWSPDGREVVFTSARGGEADLYIQPADGSEPARLVGGRPSISDYATQWLEDGTIIFDGLAPSDIYTIDASGDAPPEALLEADWSESAPRVSPDRRWMAYSSSEDGGRSQLFVRRWPDLSDRTQVTSGDVGISGGDNGLVWSLDSRTVYFRREGRLWTATLTSDAPAFQVEDTGIAVPAALWDLHPDGRIVVQASAAAGDAGLEAEPPRMVVVANWTRLLRERLGAQRAR